VGPYELLEKVVEAFDRLRITYLVTGSVASMAEGPAQEQLPIFASHLQAAFGRSSFTKSSK
jgi:hypothetical protein